MDGKFRRAAAQPSGSATRSELSRAKDGESPHNVHREGFLVAETLASILLCGLLEAKLRVELSYCGFTGGDSSTANKLNGSAEYAYG